jgi:predicted dinucleotide-binding enzyme
MKVALLGTGTAGSALADRARAVGHDVTAFNTKDSAGSIAAAIGPVDLVALAIPFAAVSELDVTVRESLKGKTVIDLTNPLTADFSALTVGFDASGGESVAAALPGAIVVKAFNTVLAQNFDPSAFSAVPVVLIAGDEPEAKGAVIVFARSLGFDTVDAGPLRNARYTEPLAGLLIQLAYVQGMGSGVALGLLRRPAAD